MADRLERFLLAGERVLYRKPEERNGWLMLCPVAFVAGLYDPSRGVLTTFLYALCVLVIYWTYAATRRGELVETVVTDRRLLRVVYLGARPTCSEVAADRIAAIEVRGHAIGVTTKAGRVEVFDQLHDAAAAGCALARAARLPAPRVPWRAERLAEEAVVLAGWAAAALAFALVFHAQSVAAAREAAAASSLAGFMLAFPAGMAGWLLGILAGLALLRPFFTLAGMRAWMWRAEIFTPSARAPAKTGGLTRFCLWFVDLLYGPPADPPGAPEEPGER